MSRLRDKVRLVRTPIYQKGAGMKLPSLGIFRYGYTHFHLGQLTLNQFLFPECGHRKNREAVELVISCLGKSMLHNWQLRCSNFAPCSEAIKQRCGSYRTLRTRIIYEYE